MRAIILHPTSFPSVCWSYIHRKSHPLCLYYSYNTTSFNLHPLADPDSAATARTNDAGKEPMRLCFLRIMLNCMI